MRIFYNNIHVKYSKPNTVMVCGVSSYFFKRTLMRAAPKTVTIIPRTCLTPLKPMGSFHQRNYPGEYRAFEWGTPIKTADPCHTRDDMGITPHEATHVNVKSATTNHVEAILTSSKGKGEPGSHFEKLSPIKYNGSFTPEKDPITKKPVLDQQGNQIPSQTKGGQYVGVLQRTRIINKDINPLKKPRPDLQPYLDKNEHKLKQIIAQGQQKTNAQIRLPKQIGGKDEE